MKYSEKNTLRLAKRYNNPKRSFLLVNPLQGKHIPVSPSESLQMMNCLGKLLAEKYSRSKLVIGFAETATAIGAQVSACMPEGCLYIQTTRESPNVKEWLCFEEEHSHASEQKISADFLSQHIADSEQIIIVDDEFSTGRTLINIVSILKKHFPELAGKQFIAASINNRVNEENMKLVQSAGISFEYLVKLPQDDYEKNVQGFQVFAPIKLPESTDTPNITSIRLPVTLNDPRVGVHAGDYSRSCEIAGKIIALKFEEKTRGKKILVLGTEECMYPGLKMGEAIEALGTAREVFFHATTRSPIGISSAEEYPIQNGYMLPSFYSHERQTYIYNMDNYDLAFVLSDTKIETNASEELGRLLMHYGCKEMVVVLGGINVQHV